VPAGHFVLSDIVDQARLRERFASAAIRMIVIFFDANRAPLNQTTPEICNDFNHKKLDVVSFRDVIDI